MKIFSCLPTFCGSGNNRNMSDYEFIDYKRPTNATIDTTTTTTDTTTTSSSDTTIAQDNNNNTQSSKWHSTKLSLDESTTIRRRWSNQVRQQAHSLIQSGYYDPSEFDTTTSFTTTSNRSSRCATNCSCSFNSSSSSSSSSSNDFPSSLITNTLQSDKSQSDDSDVSTAHVLNEVYVCFYEFKSNIDGDLPLEYGQRVRLLNHPKSNSEYFLAETLLGDGEKGRRGFVPRFCLKPLEQFLASFN
jgi:hypothetical protein